LRDRDKWNKYLDWLVEKTVLFRKVFRPRVKKLQANPGGQGE
jgi:hypothetical protein